MSQMNIECEDQNLDSPPESVKIYGSTNKRDSDLVEIITINQDVKKEEDRDLDSPESVKMYGSTFKYVKSQKETNDRDSDLVELITVNQDVEREEETLHLVISIGEGPKNDPIQNCKLSSSNSSSVCCHEPTCNMDSGETKDTKLREDLFSKAAEGEPTASQYVSLNDRRLCKGEYGFVHQVEVHDLPKTLDGFTSEEDFSKNTISEDHKYTVGPNGVLENKTLANPEDVGKEMTRSSNPAENNLVDHVEVHDIPKNLDCFTFQEDVNKINEDGKYLVGPTEVLDLPKTLNCSSFQEDVGKEMPRSSSEGQNDVKDHVKVHGLPETFGCLNVNKNIVQSSGQEDTCLLGQTGAEDLAKTSDSSNFEDDLHRNSNEVPKDQTADEPEESSNLLNGQNYSEQECPICTEVYDASSHKQLSLHCNHIFCKDCVKMMAIKASQANVGLLRCPICRQRTPMVEWEIRSMQDQMLNNDVVCVRRIYIPPEPLVRRPGLCGALEYRFQKRLHSGIRFRFLPCFPRPYRLVRRMRWLQRHCRCLYLCVALFFLSFEYLLCLMAFTPMFVFILMAVLRQ